MNDISERNDHRFRFSLRSLIAVPASITAMTVLVSTMYVTTTRGCVSEQQFFKIDEGMSKAEVRDILGEPAEINGSEWRYYVRHISTFVEFEGHPAKVKYTWAL